MSGFDLVPVDGGDPVHLPPGETVLGRGPLLGISDKRVSRHHGLLENLSGELRLKATHLNPCFIQSTPTNDPRPLQKGSWHVLRHGDFFSLLPGRFIYEVVSVGGDERTPSVAPHRNSQMLEEEEETLAVPPDPAVDPRPAVRLNQEEPPPSAAPEEDEEAERPFKGDSVGSAKDDQRDAAPSVTRRRVLPAWMLVAVPAAKTPSSTPTVRTCRPAAPSPATKRAAVAQATPTATSSPEEAEFSRKEEERPRKKKRKLSDDEEQPEEAAAHHPAKPNRSEDSGENDRFTMKAEAEDKANESEKEGKMSENNGTSKRAEPAGSNGDAESSPAPSKARVRTPCPYGKDCYRKNPLHFQECSHPGDTDYEEEEEEEEEEEDKPECPYGTDCYRKNPLHRKEYKHTKKPARHVAKKTPADEDDEDEYEDSFINDDSEDAGDDSDYVPPDSDDSGKEDIKGLQREATAFLKRRK
ncbi:aprataxin and PNK-like factor isoform X2 [Oreochromis niloticus]|uniref:aprataxin and PNK-like factor isoform X2 n=1 Tax=Oreochromis niloticus TaxID=8128 RepID=UPI000393C944|nr:aprataxin and PNK-like factor isoform X2 [Oreochromis niloticus]